VGLQGFLADAVDGGGLAERAETGEQVFDLRLVIDDETGGQAEVADLGAEDPGAEA
jgi:hypothetical protein